MKEDERMASTEAKIEGNKGGEPAVKPKEEEAVGSKLVTPIFSQAVAVIIRSDRL